MGATPTVLQEVVDVLSELVVVSEVPTAPRHLSPSSAAMFTQCPLRWKFRYRDRLPDPAGPAALVGTLAHRILELLLNETPTDRTPERAKELAGATWPEFALSADYVGLELDAEAQRRFKWQVWQAVTGLWQLEDPASVQVEATEQRVETTLGGVPFLGVVDRVDRAADGIIVTDYKSGRPPLANRHGEKLDQVLLYAGAVAATTGCQPRRARLLYLGSTVIEADSTAARVEEAVGRLAGTWAALNEHHDADDFPPQPGPLCGWCPFAGDCPVGQTELRRRLATGRLPAHAPAFRFVA